MADPFSVLSNFLVASKHASLDREESRHTRTSGYCPVCGYAIPLLDARSREDVCRFAGGRLRRFYCPKCDALVGPFKMLDMTPVELATEYAILYSTYSEGETVEDTVRTFQSLEPERGPVYLDWGCGWWSSAISRLRGDGWNVWGYEPTPGGPSDHIVSDMGHIAPGLAGIYSNNVIEHLTDPVATFQQMRALLRPGGRMAHSSPCYAERYLDTRFHTIFFLGRSIERLAERTGFKVVRRESDGEYMNTVLQAV